MKLSSERAFLNSSGRLFHSVMVREKWGSVTVFVGYHVSEATTCISGSACLFFSYLISYLYEIQTSQKQNRQTDRQKNRKIGR